MPPKNVFAGQEAALANTALTAANACIDLALVQQGKHVNHRREKEAFFSHCLFQTQKLKALKVTQVSENADKSIRYYTHPCVQSDSPEMQCCVVGNPFFCNSV